LPETGKLTIQIFDQVGRLVLEKKSENKNKETLHISSLPNGVYIIRLQTNEGVYTSNFVKE